MFRRPKLTICVPSRNRQSYFQETIRSLVANLRLDVEFVFADNSDDALVMDAWITDILGDPRIRFLPSENRVLSMMDNWERCVEAATGEFLCIIGDDDYVDPDIADVIARLQETPGAKPVEALVWQRLYYNWPDNRPFVNNVSVQLSANIVCFPTQTVSDVFFSWAERQPMPTAAYSVYHGAISRLTMDRIRSRFAGRYFEHPVVDMENACKLLTVTENIYFSERPFSVMGSCAKSNSARSYQTDEARKMYENFLSEVGRDIDDGLEADEFPFRYSLGSAACVAQTQHWFLNTYGDRRRPGWELNFAAACSANCSVAHDVAYYDVMVSGYGAAMRRWRGGKFLSCFSPKPFRDPKSILPFFGVAQNFLFVQEAIGDLATPGEFYALIARILVRPADLSLNFTVSSEDLTNSFKRQVDLAV